MMSLNSFKNYLPIIIFLLLLFCFESLKGYDDILTTQKKINTYKVYSRKNTFWKLEQVTLYEYNDGVDTIIHKQLYSDSLMNNDMTVIKYALNGIKIGKETTSWDHRLQKWQNETKNLYFYDNEIYIIRDEGYIWMKEWSWDNWQLKSNTLFYYDSLKRKTNEEKYIYIYISGKDSTYRQLYQYHNSNFDTLNFITKSIIYNYNAETKDTTPNLKYEYFYDKYGNLINTKISRWYQADKLWKKTSDNWKNYKFDEKNRVKEKLYFSLENEKDTIFEYKESYQYNDKGELVEEIDEIYVDSISSFVNASRRNHYYSDNIIDSTIIYIWKNNEWELKTKMEYIYIVTDVEENKGLKLEQIISISPNPAKEYIEIEFSSPRLKPWVAGEDAIKIYNLLGECVLSTSEGVRTHPLIPSQEGNIRIDVSGLPPGVYFVRLGDWTGRFVKI